MFLPASTPIPLSPLCYRPLIMLCHGVGPSYLPFGVCLLLFDRTLYPKTMRAEGATPPVQHALKSTGPATVNTAPPT